MIQSYGHFRLYELPRFPGGFVTLRFYCILPHIYTWTHRQVTGLKMCDNFVGGRFKSVVST